MLKKRVLDVAVNEVNDKSPLEVRYELEKVGRGVQAVHFFINEKKEDKLNLPQNTSIFDKLVQYGFKEQQIKKLLNTYERDYLLENIVVVEEHLQKGKKIKDITAYLATAFKNDYRNVLTAHEKEVIERKKQKKRSLEKAKELEEEMKERLRDQQDQQIAYLFDNMTEEEKKKLDDDFLHSKKMSNKLMQTILANSDITDPKIQAAKRTYIVENLLPKHLRSLEAFTRENA